nr:protein HEAT INTOLERANT 4-like [Ipomoea batatas]
MLQREFDAELIHGVLAVAIQGGAEVGHESAFVVVEKGREGPIEIVHRSLVALLARVHDRFSGLRREVLHRRIHGGALSLDLLRVLLRRQDRLLRRVVEVLRARHHLLAQLLVVRRLAVLAGIVHLARAGRRVDHGGGGHRENHQFIKLHWKNCAAAKVEVSEAITPPYASSTPLETCAAAKVEVSEAITPPYASSTPLETSAATAAKVGVCEGGRDTNVAPQTLAINTVVPPQQSFSPLSSTVALSSTEPKPLPSPIAAVAEPNPLPSAEQKPSPSLPPAEDLWQQVFTVGTKWDQLDMVYQYKWNFSNLETLNFIEYDSLFPDEEKQAIMVLKESCNLNNASLQAEIGLVCE